MKVTALFLLIISFSATMIGGGILWNISRIATAIGDYPYWYIPFYYVFTPIYSYGEIVGGNT